MKKEMFADDGVELTEEEYAALLSWNDQDVAFVKSDKIENGEIWRVYTADGTPAGSVETEYDLFGRLRQRNLYNINGACLQSEVFHHRFWERYGSLTGLFFLIVAVCFSLWAAGNVPVPGSPRKPKR